MMTGWHMILLYVKLMVQFSYGQLAMLHITKNPSKYHTLFFPIGINWHDIYYHFRFIQNKFTVVKIFIYNFNVAIAYWLENVTDSSSVLVVYITYQNI